MQESVDLSVDFIQKVVTKAFLLVDIVVIVFFFDLNVLCYFLKAHTYHRITPKATTYDSSQVTHMVL